MSSARFQRDYLFNRPDTWVAKLTFCGLLFYFHTSNFFHLPKGDVNSCSTFPTGFLSDANETKAKNPLWNKKQNNESYFWLCLDPCEMSNNIQIPGPSTDLHDQNFNGWGLDNYMLKQCSDSVMKSQNCSLLEHSTLFSTRKLSWPVLSDLDAWFLY